MTAGAKTPMSDVPQTTESASAEGPMIRFDELTKRFRGSTQPAVDRVSMDIRRGETVVLVGPSGCGKTTTTELINRLIEPTSGRIVLDGEDATRADPTRCAAVSVTSSRRPGSSRTRPSRRTSPPSPGCSAGRSPASTSSSA
jgi:ABC-type glutathione transport system ATPase component